MTGPRLHCLACTLLGAAALGCGSARPASESGQTLLLTAAGEGSSSVETLAVGENGVIFAGGYFEGTLQWGKARRQSKGSRDGFVGALAASGEPLWLYTFGGSLQDEVAALVVASDGTLVAAGWHADRVDFDPGPSELPFSRPGTHAQAALVGLSQTGELRFAQVLPGVIDADYSSINSLAAWKDEILAGGVARGTIRAGAGSTEVVRTIDASQAGFVARLSLSGQVLGLELFDSRGEDSAFVAAGEPPLIAGRFAAALRIAESTFEPAGASNAFVVDAGEVRSLGDSQALVGASAALRAPRTLLFGTLRGSAFGLEARDPATFVVGWDDAAAMPSFAHLLEADVRSPLHTAIGTFAAASGAGGSELLELDAEGRAIRSVPAAVGVGLRALAADGAGLLVAGRKASGSGGNLVGHLAFVARQTLPD